MSRLCKGKLGSRDKIKDRGAIQEVDRLETNAKRMEFGGQKFFRIKLI